MDNTTDMYSSFGQLFGTDPQNDQRGDLFQFSTEYYGAGGPLPGQLTQRIECVLDDQTPHAESYFDLNASQQLPLSLSAFTLETTQDPREDNQTPGPLLFGVDLSQNTYLPTTPTNTTPSEPIQPLYKSVNQALISSMPQVFSYPLGNEITQSNDSPITPPESSPESTPCIPRTGPVQTRNFVPLSFRGSGFMAKQMSQNSNDIQLPIKYTFPQMRTEIRTEGSTSSLITIITSLLEEKGISLPDNIARVQGIETPNPCFASAREAMVLEWLVATHPDVFLDIPNELMSATFRNKQEEMRCELFIKEVFALAHASLE